MMQATIVSVVTWLTIYLVATRVFKLDPQFGAVLGAGGAVCGVSASIAVGGAVKAKNEHISISIAVCTIWAIIMIFVLSFAFKQLVPQTVSPAWRAPSSGHRNLPMRPVSPLPPNWEPVSGMRRFRHSP